MRSEPTSVYTVRTITRPACEGVSYGRHGDARQSVKSEELLALRTHVDVRRDGKGSEVVVGRAVLYEAVACSHRAAGTQGEAPIHIGNAILQFRGESFPVETAPLHEVERIDIKNDIGIGAR